LNARVTAGLSFTVITEQGMAAKTAPVRLY
jgi:hypothetical protein